MFPIFERYFVLIHIFFQFNNLLLSWCMFGLVRCIFISTHIFILVHIFLIWYVSYISLSPPAFLTWLKILPQKYLGNQKIFFLLICFTGFPWLPQDCPSFSLLLFFPRWDCFCFACLLPSWFPFPFGHKVALRLLSCLSPCSKLWGGVSLG